MVFTEELNKFLQIFEPYLEKYFKDKIKNLDSYPPLIGRFYRDLFDFASSGKRLRAFLVYLGYKTSGGDNLRKILPIALAFEVIHSFLLIHDDIIDKSQKRRGKLTIHKRYEKLADEHYGMSQAIIIGDIACFEAIKLVNSSGFASEIKILCLDKLIGVILETAYGEALDVENALFKKRAKVSVLDVWRVTDLKTARYSFVGPLTIGAVLSKSKKNQLNSLSEYGLYLGKAFQLQDDILGIFGSEKKTGKSTLSDLREGKNTLLIFKALEKAKGENRKIILNLWGKSDAKMADLEKIRKIISKTVLSWCEAEKTKLANLAARKVKKITGDKKLQRVYLDLCNFVINRES